MLWFLQVLILFGNVWIWRILNTSFWIGLLTLITTVSLYEIVRNSTRSKIFYFFFSLLLLFQFRTTQARSLTLLTNDDRRIVDQRLKEYPPVHLKIGSKTLWIPLAHWLEEKNVSIVFRRLKNSLFENLSPNLYFFANHPRERVVTSEFEKYPYILFIPFLIGAYQLFQKRKNVVIFTFLSPLFITMLIGNQNYLGPFAIFPIFTVSIIIGCKYLLVASQKIPKYWQSPLLIFFIVLYLLTLTQAFIYT